MSWRKAFWFAIITAAALWASGVVPAIVPALAPAANKRGNSAIFQLADVTTLPAANNCAKFDASGNIADSGSACGGSGSGTVNSGTQFQIAEYLGAGTTTAVSGVSIPDCPDSAGKHVNFTAATGVFTCGTTGNAGTGLLFSGSTNPAVPTIVDVQHHAAVATFSLAYTGSVTSGNLLILSLGFFTSTAGAVAVSDTRGNTWTQAHARTCNGSGLVNCGELWFTITGSSGADTVTWSATSAGFAVTAIAEYSGVSGTLDNTTSVVATTPAASITSVPYVTVITAVAMAHNSNVITAVAPSTISVQANGNGGVGVGFDTKTLGTTFTPGFTNTVGTTNDAVWTEAGFKPNAVVSPGNNGDWYLNTTSGVLWGPKAGGSWTPSVFSWAGNSSSTGTNNHVVFGGAAPSVSACGTTPNGSISAASTDNAGVITVGGGVVTACTVTFAKAFTSAPSCHVETGTAAITSSVSAVSTAAVTFTFSATVGSGTLYYSCF